MNTTRIHVRALIERAGKTYRDRGRHYNGRRRKATPKEVTA